MTELKMRYHTDDPGRVIGECFWCWQSIAENEKWVRCKNVYGRGVGRSREFRKEAVFHVRCVPEHRNLTGGDDE